MRRRNGDPIFFVIILSVVAIFAVAEYFIRKVRRQRRTEALQQVAAELGLTFSPQGNEQLISQLGWCELFSSGRNKAVRNLMQSSNEDREIAVFDYQYVTGYGKNKRTWCSTVVCLRSAGAPLPRFAMRPEGAWDKISNWFGSADIDFDTHPKFSRSFVLRGPDEPAIRTLFIPAVLEHFEQHTGISAEGADDTLLCYRHRKTVPPADISQFLADAFTPFSMFRA